MRSLHPQRAETVVQAAKGADGIGQGAAKRLEKPGHLEKTTPPKHAGTALLPELSRSATPKQHDGLAALVPVLLPQQQAGLASPQKQPQPLQDGDKPRESAVETTILPCTSAREDELALSADVGSDPEDLSQVLRPRYFSKFSSSSLSPG